MSSMPASCSTMCAGMMSVKMEFQSANGAEYVVVMVLPSSEHSSDSIWSKPVVPAASNTSSGVTPSSPSTGLPASSLLLEHAVAGRSS